MKINPYSNNHKMTISILFVFILILSGCSTKIVIQPPKVNSPLGIYKSNTLQKYWLAIMQNDQYFLCSPSECFKGKYEKVPVNYGVILTDFYLSDIGLAIEKLSHGNENTLLFLTKMKKIRQTQLRPNDLAFNIGDCKGTPCAGIGHVRNGVKFFKVEDFDTYWER